MSLECGLVLRSTIIKPEAPLALSFGFLFGPLILLSICPFVLFSLEPSYLSLCISNQERTGSYRPRYQA